MIALGIRYLMRRSVAATINDRSVPEWPPHPGRVFMALAAAHFESPQPDPAEREALEWLEQQNAPSLTAVNGPPPRTPVETYVPANDTAAGIGNRPRTPRTFAGAYVGDDPVYLHWDADPPRQHREALEKLSARVTRIGHSSSPVQVWVGSDAPAANWLPAARGQTLRIPGEGTMRNLRASFQAGQRPKLARWKSYANPASVPAATMEGPFDPDLIIFARRDGTNLGLEATLPLTAALRNAAMNFSQPPPEWLSGHTAGGDPSPRLHAAFFPLPTAGHPQADGHLLGVALALPRGLTDDQLGTVLQPFLFDPDGGDREFALWRPNPRVPGGKPYYWEWKVQRETSGFAPLALRARTWVGPAETWVSVTPVVLHHYPKPNRGGDLERIVLEAFESAGLPRPASIRLSPAPLVTGAVHARAMPEYSEGGAKLCRYQIHAEVTFPAKVLGPVLVGRGRFRGYGLFRPAPEPHDD